MVKFIFLFYVWIIFSSCFSIKKIADQPPTVIDQFSIENFNGNYSNCTLDSTEALTLWKALYECKSFNFDSTHLTKKTIVNLFYNGGNKIIVKAIEDGVIINGFELKGKRFKNYFSIDRKLILIPIPFLYFRQSERKVLLGLKNGNLIVKGGLEEDLWILFAAGYGGIYCIEYRKILP